MVGQPKFKKRVNTLPVVTRLVKEAIHELGHNFGLIHCNNQSCVMKSSTYVEEVDQKSVEMCSRCQETLRGLCNY